LHLTQKSKPLVAERIAALEMKINA
jgi:hypothetical protein